MTTTPTLHTRAADMLAECTERMHQCRTWVQGYRAVPISETIERANILIAELRAAAQPDALPSVDDMKRGLFTTIQDLRDQLAAALRERDEWAAKFTKTNRELGALKFPECTGNIKGPHANKVAKS